jgi:elongator complex protein 4
MIRNTSVAVLITLPPHLSTRSPQLSGDGDADDHWIDKLGYLSDGCITLSSFGGKAFARVSSAPRVSYSYHAGDPSLADLFQTYHGAVHIHSSPSPHAMLPPSHKHSVLRGLASSSNQVGGGGENNLAFRCTRKRFIIETLHLDVEGGVGERRTTAPPGGLETPKPNAGSAGHGSSTQATAPAHPAAEEKPGKQKKRVAFQADRPELYDF